MVNPWRNSNSGDMISLIDRLQVRQKPPHDNQSDDTEPGAVATGFANKNKCWASYPVATAPGSVDGFSTLLLCVFVAKKYLAEVVGH